MTLHGLVVGLAAAALVLLPAGLYLERKALKESVPGAGRGAWACLALMLAAHAVFVRMAVPHGIWHEQHGADLVFAVDTPLGGGGLAETHGPAYELIMKAGHAASAGRASVFSINYAISLLSAVLLFLCLLMAGEGPALGLAGAGVLLALPARIRLSASESMFIPVEALLVLWALILGAAFRTGRPRLFAIALLPAFLLMNLRAEMWALAPVSAGLMLWAFRDRLDPKMLREPWIVAGTAAAALALLPRLAEILTRHDERIGRFVPALDDAAFWSLGLKGANVFFDSAITPWALPLLAAAGAFFLFRSRPRTAVAILAHLGIHIYLYALHLSCLSLRVRTAMTTQFAFAALAAYGFHAATARLAGGPRGAARLLAAAALVLVPVRYLGFITARYSQTEEFALLERARDALPEGALVVVLSAEDDPTVEQTRYGQREVLRRAPGKPLLLGIRRFLDLLPEIDGGRLFYFEGADCFSLPWKPGAPEGLGRTPDYANPLCAEMRRLFELDPAVAAEVSSDSLSWDRMEGGTKTLGLYAIRLRPGAAPGPGIMPPGEPPAGTWIVVANAALAAGRRRLARAALARIEPSSLTGFDRVNVIRLFRELGDDD